MINVSHALKDWQVRKMHNRKKRLTRAIGNAITIISFLFILWIVASWMNVLAHNDPWKGDRKYAPNNAFVVLEQICK